MGTVAKSRNHSSSDDEAESSHFCFPIVSDDTDEVRENLV